jgi:hypothetical protein
MSLIPGQPVKAVTDNAAFMSRLSNSDTVGIQGFKHPSSGGDINNIQAYVNKLASILGDTTETGTGQLDYSSTNYIADNDTHKDAIEKLDAQLALTQAQLSALDLANSEDVTLTAIGSSPNANGASLAGQALTLQPANGSNPGLITAGTQSIGGNKTFTGNVTVEGDLTVNGTTTSINTANLDVEDVNILVNKNGTDLTAEGAGLTVERPLGNAGFQFDSTLASYFKLGLNSQLREVIVNGVAQIVGGIKDFISGLKSDSINESTLNAGVTVDGVLIKDGLVDGRDVSVDGTAQDNHIASTSNPHSVTKAQVGLGNVTDDAQLKRAAADFNSFTEKLSVDNDDLILIEDSAASLAKKKVKRSNFGGSGGGIQGVFRYQVNGLYNQQGALTGPDGVFIANQAIKVERIECYVDIAGSSGSTTFDLQYQPPAGSFATMLSTQGSITSAAGNNADIGTGETKANMTAPVMTSTPFLVAANGKIRMDLTAVQAGAPNSCAVFIYYSLQ